MARVNHKLVKQRLNEKRSKITDRQFFSSRILAGHFEDLAAAQTRRYLGLYITPECLEDPGVAPLIYCVASHCVLQDGKWIPVELYESSSACLQEKCV